MIVMPVKDVCIQACFDVLDWCVLAVLLSSSCAACQVRGVPDAVHHSGHHAVPGQHSYFAVNLHACGMCCLSSSECPFATGICYELAEILHQ